jgi:hypothetical protein
VNVRYIGCGIVEFGRDDCEKSFGGHISLTIFTIYKTFHVKQIILLGAAI